MFEKEILYKNETEKELRKKIAIQLRTRVMKTLAVNTIEESCHRQSQQKLCASFRKSRKKPFCCHVIEINDGTFKKNLDYLGDVYGNEFNSNNGIEIKPVNWQHDRNFTIFMAVLPIPFFLFFFYQVLTMALDSALRNFRQNNRRENFLENRQTIRRHIRQ